MVIDTETVVNATEPIKSVNNEGYTMWGTLSSVSNSNATGMKSLVFDSSTNFWNLVPADETTTIAPFTAYAQVRNTTASNTDVPNVFLDPQYFYSVGTAKHMLDGEDVKSLSTDEMTLVDAQDFKADEGVKSFTADKAAYARDMSTTWGTLCLPYAIEADGNETCEFYAMAGEQSDNQVTLHKITGTIDAGTPVVVRRRDGVSTVVINAEESVGVVTAATDGSGMTGSFVETTVPEGAYIISKDKFWLVGSASGAKGAKVKAYRGYINASASGSKAASLGIATDDQTTAIGTVDTLNTLTDSADSEYYDASGRRLDGLQRGLNIVKSGNRTVKVMIQ